MISIKTPPSHAFKVQGAEPFESVEDAWFWCVAAMEAKGDGARTVAGMSLVPRPCEAVDIIKAIDTLYRNRRLMIDHIRVLKHYGVRHMAPDPRRKREARAFTLWDEAMVRLESVLETKGILRIQESHHEKRDKELLGSTASSHAYERGLK